jgi:dTMP kinase
MIITFEGGEGSGKGTQIKLLETALADKGLAVLSIVEPGGTPAGQAIRDVLLNRKELEILGVTETFLFSASRAQQVREVVRPALEKGAIVISDRSFYSTFAYQGHARGEDMKLITTLTDLAVGETKPDIVILLDLPPEIGLARKHSQNEVNRLDAESLTFHQKVREGYLELAKEHPNSWTVIDATLSVEQIHDLVLETVINSINQIAQTPSL